METLLEDNELIKEYQGEIDVITEAHRYAVNQGKVHVFKSVYPGSIIVFGNDLIKIRKENVFCSYKKYAGEITFSECELTIDSIK